MEFDPEEIRARGWRQGSLISATDSNEFSGYLPDLDVMSDDDVLVVATHDCDLVHPSLEAEPDVELLLARRVEKVDGNLTYGKSPRRLAITEGDIHYEISVRSRSALPRDQLCGVRPSGRLSDPNLKLVRRLLSNRYARAAFPDEFNRRVRRVKDRVDALARLEGGAYISGIYVFLHDVELPKESDYTIILIGTMPTLLFKSEKHAIAEEVFGKIAGLVAGCEGIDLSDYELRPENEMSLEDVNLLKRWDELDSTSFRPGSQPPDNLSTR